MNKPLASGFHAFPKDPDYLAIARAIDQRRAFIKSQLAKRRSPPSGHFYDDGQYPNSLIDAYHGEMHFGADPASVVALEQAWQQTLHEQQQHFIQHNKKQPDALRELTVNFLFERLLQPGIVGVSGLPLHPDDAVVVPYSSTQLLIAALNSRPKKHLQQVACPEGFYKGAAKLAAAAGMHIKTFPVDLDRDGVIIPEVLDHYLACHHRETALLWLTLPGNPLIANHSLERSQAIADILVKYDVDVLIDMAFDKLLPPGMYLPLPNMRVHTPNGQWHTLHERTFSITGNSKGLGGISPWKLGAGVCGHRQWLQNTLDTVTAVTFQRESTHLIYSGLKAVSSTYLANNQQTLKDLQNHVKTSIQQLNEALGEQALVSYGEPVYTPFHCVGLSQTYLEKAGITDSLQCADFLLAGAGIESVELDLVGIRQAGVRLNVTSPRINGQKSPQHIEPLFKRLKGLLTAVQQGLQYTDVLKRIGVKEKTGWPAVRSVL